MPATADLTADEIEEALRLHGSVSAAAEALGLARSTLRRRIARKSPGTPAPPGPITPSVPRLTRQALHEALKPPNNCHVKRFSDVLDPSSRKVLDEALIYDKRDLPASRLREILLDAGFEDAAVPGVDAINAHRSGARPCRCKG